MMGRLLGHSNGGGFTYLLWAARGDVFAAVAPCAAAARPEFKQHMKPKPVLHMAGENDPLVKFAWQQRTIDELRKINGCGEGKPWGEHCTMYPSKIGTPVVTYCTGGVRSALLAVLLEARLGIVAANYDGSLWEWSSRDDLPLETGR